VDLASQLQHLNPLLTYSAPQQLHSNKTALTDFITIFLNFKAKQIIFQDLRPRRYFLSATNLNNSNNNNSSNNRIHY